MFVINALRKTAGELSKNAGHASASSKVLNNHFIELDEILHSIQPIGPGRIKINGKSIATSTSKSADHILDTVGQIYKLKFNKEIPEHLSNLIRNNVITSSHIDNVVDNAAFMRERVDSYDRLLSMVLENSNGYRDSMDRIYKYLSETHQPGAAVKSVGKKYRILLPAGIIGVTGTGYVFFKAMVKTICDNNEISGCIWTKPRGLGVCKLTGATCDPVYKASGSLMKDCGSVEYTTSDPCFGWNNFAGAGSSAHKPQSICQNCALDRLMGIASGGNVSCVEPPNVGTILTDALSMGFDDINTAVTGFGTFIEGVLRYAHYGFLLLIVLIVGFIYSRLKSITIGDASGFQYRRLSYDG